MQNQELSQVIFNQWQPNWEQKKNQQVQSEAVVQSVEQRLKLILHRSYNHKQSQEMICIWEELRKQFNISVPGSIRMLYNNELLILWMIENLMELEFGKNTKRIISTLVEHYDPSKFFIKKLIQKLVPALEEEQFCVNSLIITLFTLNTLFKQQTPTNNNLDSYILLDEGEGLQVNQKVRWPFQKSGTITLWYNMKEECKECKLFQIISEEKMGFQIVLKNKKIYFQKISEDTRFRIMKNNSAYLCEALFDENVKLCIQFQIKKRFFQPSFVINVIMNNFVMNNIEVDSVSFSVNQFKISLFKKYKGKVYSVLILTQNLAGQVQELNSRKGFIYENDIKNFTYIFENNVNHIYLLYSAIRARTVYADQLEQQQSKEDQKQKNDKCLLFLFKNEPQYTIVFDAINRRNAIIGAEGSVSRNISIKKEIINYGGLYSFLPFLNLLKCNCPAEGEESQTYNIALNEFMGLIKNIFLNKTESIEQAFKIRLFRRLSIFFSQTKMAGFSEQLISNLKEIYISLNTRMMRQNFMKDLVWNISAGEYLFNQKLDLFIRFVKYFYTEDIMSNLNIFSIKDIIGFMLDKFDQPNCCSEHARNSIDGKRKIPNYSNVLRKYFEIILNILLIKRVQVDIQGLVKEIAMVFSLSTSACFTESFLEFLSTLFDKDKHIERIFIEIMQAHIFKMTVYTTLAYSYSWLTKGKLIDLILHIYGLNMIKEGTNFDRDLISLCIRYPMITARMSSIKSQDFDHSIDASEDKISLNSGNMRKWVTIKSIKSQEMVLLNNEEIIKIIWEWALLKEVIDSLNDDFDNPGISILIQLYKGSTYKLRKSITSLILQRIQLTHFTPDFMAWVTECLLISQYDCELMEESEQPTRKLIEETKQNLLQIICCYQMDGSDSNQQNELYIIKLVLASVKTKYPQQIANLSNIIFLLVCEKMMHCFYDQLQKKMKDEVAFNNFCERVISNIYRCLLEYFSSKKDDVLQFEEEQSQRDEQQAGIMLRVLEKLFQILVHLTAPNEDKILAEANALRNKYILQLLFPIKQAESISLMCFLFVALQMLFECSQDLNIDARKRIFALIKKYLKFLIELSQNSGSLKLQAYEDELRNIFTNSLGFLQNKFYQYFYYSFERINNLEYSIQSKIRKNVQDIKKIIFNIFIELIELMKYIDKTGSMEHKSFYQLMKPKKHLKSEMHLKNFYPVIWKKADQKIIEFMYLSIETLKQDAKQKLQNHLLQKRLSSYSSSIEKTITKNIQAFIQKQKKENSGKQKNSVFIYLQHETQKCKALTEYEEQITVLMYENGNRQRIQQTKRKQIEQTIRRQLIFHGKKMWTSNRTYEGFWANLQFYGYSQNADGFTYDNKLSKFYKRVRSSKQSKYCLTPFIRIESKILSSEQSSINENRFEEQIYIKEKQNQGEKPQLNINELSPPSAKEERSKSQKYLKIGLGFIKKRVIEKIMRSSLMSNLHKDEKQKNELVSNKKIQPFKFFNALLIKPMKLYAGTVKIDASFLIFQYTSCSEYQHLSLLKTKQLPTDLLMQKWAINDIEYFQLKKFMLKINSVQIFFKQRRSIFIAFPRSQFGLNKFIELLLKFKRQDIPLQRIPLIFRFHDPFKPNAISTITESWRNRDISNFEYLMCLNIMSGRTNCDLNQYFVFPWIMASYQSTKFKKEEKWRDLQKNMGSLGSNERLQKFMEIYTNISQNYKDQFLHSHHFGFHYSNIAIVLQYLIRISPFAEGAMHLQGGKFDIPDRLFTSIGESFRNATTQMSDVRELIPQFFYFPQFLNNSEDFQFGVQQNSKIVNHVQLPDGYQNSYDFIQNHRQCLQSEQVSANLHKWIDLIFGYKQSGKEAEMACNKFHYLTYQTNAATIYSEQKSQNKESIQSQMAYFGKVPTQLFTKPHPKRSIPNNKIHFSKYSRANPFLSEPSLSLQLAAQLINHSSGYFSLPLATPIHLHYSASNNRYLTLRRDGKGLIFNLQKSDSYLEKSKLQGQHQRLLSINVVMNFEIFLDRFENVYIFDERINFNMIPICCLWSQHLFFGGLWAGKLLKYDIISQKYEFSAKHSDTITALSASQDLQMVVSGSINGQIIIWQYAPKPGGHTKLIFKQKIVPHYSFIKQISISVDLRTIVSGSIDGYISVIDIQKGRLVRQIKIGEPIEHCIIVSYPYYMYFVSCSNNKQYCISLNGQFLEQSSYESLKLTPQVLHFQATGSELLMIKESKKSNFMFISLPSLSPTLKMEIKEEDNDEGILQCLVSVGEGEIELLFNTKESMIYTSITDRKQKEAI